MKSRIYIESSVLCHERMSGIGHNTLELVRELDNLSKKSFELILIVPWRKSKIIDKYNFKNTSIKKLFFPMKLMVIIDSFKILPPIDLFFGQGSYLFPNYVNFPVSKRSQNLTYIYDIGFIKVPEFVSPKNREFLANNIKRWVKRSAKILTISDFSKNEIIKEFPSVRGSTYNVSCGVRHDIFSKVDPATATKILAKYDISQKGYFLYVGNIEPRKNIIGILNAYERLDKKLQTNHPLIIVGGGGWLNNDIDKKISELQNKGLQVLHPNKYFEDADLPALYSNAVALVHPAFYEGFGLSLVQAMASMTPVITSRSSSMPEVVGQSAILVDPKNNQQLARAMEDVVSKKIASVMVREGYERSKRYSWKLTAKNVLLAIEDKPVI